MNKKLFALIIASLLLMAMIVPAAATDVVKLYDIADLITDSEEERIAEKLDEIGEKHDVNLAIVTVDTIEDEDPDEFAEMVFDEEGYGEADNGGILLFIALESRDVVVFYDSVIDMEIADSIREEVTPYLSDEDYSEAFNTFIEKCDYYVDGELNGYPFNWTRNIVIAVVIGLILALIITGGMKGQLKSVKAQRAASNYVTSGSLNVTEARDNFLYRNIVRHKKESSSSSSSGSSGGRSRGSSSGKF